MEKHIPFVGWLNIGYNILGLFGGLVAFMVLYGVSMVPDVRHEGASFILQLIAQVVIIFVIITSLPGIVGGIGVLQRRTWGRIVVIIVSFLNLLSIPFGTALGIYSLWVLLKEETAKLFS